MPCSILIAQAIASPQGKPRKHRANQHHNVSNSEHAVNELNIPGFSVLYSNLNTHHTTHLPQPSTPHEKPPPSAPTTPAPSHSPPPPQPGYPACYPSCSTCTHQHLKPSPSNNHLQVDARTAKSRNSPLPNLLIRRHPPHILIPPLPHILEARKKRRPRLHRQKNRICHTHHH